MENRVVECCGVDILTCAKRVAILGIIFSVLTLNILGLIIWILAYNGIQEHRPGNLMFAKIYLILELVVLSLIFIAGIVVGIIFAVAKKPETENSILGPIFIVIFALIILFACFGTIFAFVIINKARNYLLLDQPKI